MADKTSYLAVVTRVRGDINYIAEEAYRDGYDHCEKEMKKRIEEAYQRGLEDGKAVNDKGCVGCKFDGNSKDHSPCDYCCNCYSSQWAAKDNKFEFGDEIIDSDGVKGCVISKDNEESNTIYALFDGYRTPQCITQRNYRKTGKRYDIDKILDEMKGTGADDDTY